MLQSGRGSAWLERPVRDREVVGSNPIAPTISLSLLTIPSRSSGVCAGVPRIARDFGARLRRRASASSSNPIAPTILSAVPYTVYVLRSDKDGRNYIGCTSGIEDRLRRHNRELVRSTRHRIPLRLIHFEVFETREQAFAREKYFESWAGRIELAKILTERKRGSAPKAGKLA